MAVEAEGIVLEIAAKTESFVDGIAKSIESLSGFQLAVAGASALVSGFLAAETVKKASEFASAVEHVGIKSNLTASQMSALHDAVRSFAMTTIGSQFASAELADALHSVAQKGKSVSDMMSILSASASYAAATEQPLAAATKQLSDLLDASSANASDAAHYADVLTASYQETTGSAAQLAASLQGSAQQARTFGVSIEQNAAMFTVLKEHGIESTSILYSAMSQLLKPASEGQRFFSSMGISLLDNAGHARDLTSVLDALGTVAASHGATVEQLFAAAGFSIKKANDGTVDLRATVEDVLSGIDKTGGRVANVFETYGVALTNANGSVRPLVDILGEFDAKTKAAGLTTEQTGQLVTTAFGPKAGGAINALRENIDTLQKRTDALTSSFGAGERVAKEMAETTDGRILGLKNRIKDAAIVIGEALLPAVEGAIKLFESLYNVWESNKDIVTGLAFGLGAVAISLVIYNADVIAATIATGAYTLATQAAFAAMVLLDSGLLPVILTIAAIGAVVALFAIAWQRDWGGIREKAAAVISWFSVNGLPILEAAIRAVVMVVTLGLSEVVIAIVQHWTEIKAAFANIAGSITGFLGDVKDAASNVAQAIIEGIGDLGKKVWDHIASGLHDTADKLSQWAKGIIGLSPTLDMIGSDIPQTIARGITSTGNPIWDALGEQLHDAAERAQTEAAALAETLKAQWATHLMVMQGDDGNAQGAHPVAMVGDNGQPVYSGTSTESFVAHTVGTIYGAHGSYQLVLDNASGFAQANGGSLGVVSGYASDIERGLGIAAGSLRSIFEANNVPYLATGGIVNRATRAIIGEAGPEAVIPLSQLDKMLPGISRGSDRVEVVVRIDPAPGLSDVIVARVERVLTRKAQRAGVI